MKIYFFRAVKNNLSTSAILSVVKQVITEVSPSIRFGQMELPIQYNSSVLVVAIGKNALVQAYAFHNRFFVKNGTLRIVPKYIIHQVDSYVNRNDTDLNEFISQNIPKLYFLPHPKPTIKTFNATATTLDQLADLSKGTEIVFLVSGGGSSSFALPEAVISPDLYLQILDKALLQGYNILELNFLRSLIDAVKGGKTLSYLPDQKVISWVTSDVISDNTQVIASGPTTPGIHNLVSPFQKTTIFKWLQNNFKVDGNRLAQRLIQPLKAEYVSKVVTSRFDLLDRLIVHLANYNFDIERKNTSISGKVNEVSKTILLDIKESTRANSFRKILVWAGEPTITISKQAFSSGVGGRTSSIAVLVGEKLDEMPADEIYFLTVATDGKDGTSPSSIYIVSKNQSSEIKMYGQGEELVYSGQSATILEKLNCGHKLGHTNINLLDVYLAVITKQ